MVRFLSPEWVDAFNRALGEAELDTAGAEGAPPTGTRYRVAQVVPDAPGGEVRTVLAVDGGRVTLERSGPDDEGGRVPPADVTVSLSYADAGALSRGELDAAQALGTGRVRVRGDLSVLVAGQAVLAAAAARLGDLAASTTY